ncbi:bifunctional biotin--[acetyl-CoA-carboxylase] ligase/biotin operon repressor BirA [Alteromonas sp. a30]|uniref:bifunctional biotin--[acetyl-CoA-carboxylase] ligase/biotin operon repressor BirA n=1 Tax=Alteromonas sp. a30 TaxID=2730917 RepID=UPI00228280CD|nr:bifunctional biotin--[acetyl-CoA-carboxylase] ligase/biotin operon repressor BirA [Alteromonas sp. a30]MCY7294775.1 bifunctional biotin--[acetyl-CoA-carboxylase] ligase/biotin operon repressor BirA [Alteromonas sp. a30]
MKSSSTIRNDILERLIGGNFCSGETLGRTLGVSRAAISKHIKALQELGLDIYSVTGKGYRLAHEIHLFDKERLLTELPNYRPEQIHLLPVVDSTNDYLKQLLQTEQEVVPGTLCIAEAQTAGRGRQGKRWVSPFGCSLYCSFYWPFDGGFQAVSGLSLAVGLALVSALEGFGAKQLGLKWPNDIYHDNKKVAGILVDVDGQMHGSCHCIIGFGVNLVLPNNIDEISQPWSDLRQIVGHVPDKNALAVAMIQQLNKTMLQFQHDGLKSFIDKWNDYDIYKEQEVALIMGENRIYGVAKGIDQTGAIRLAIKDDTGQTVVRSFFGGEISVRAV